MSPENTNRGHGWWEPARDIMVPVWELVIHVVVGSLLFAIIFTPAVILDFLVEWLKGNLSEFLAHLLTWTKYAVAIIDVVLYLLFMVVMAALFIIKLWRMVVKSWSSRADEQIQPIHGDHSEGGRRCRSSVFLADHSSREIDEVIVCSPRKSTRAAGAARHRWVENRR